MWVPPEDKDPIVLHAPTRKSVACFGAVTLRTGQFVRTICQVVQCRNLSALPRAVAAASNARSPYHSRAGQRSLPSRCNPGPVPAPAHCTLEASVSSTLQSSTGTHRAGLQADSPPSDAQPLLPYTRRSAQRRECLLQSLASPEHDPTETMLHYLRRCVENSITRSQRCRGGTINSRMGRSVHPGPHP